MLCVMKEVKQTSKTHKQWNVRDNINQLVFSSFNYGFIRFYGSIYHYALLIMQLALNGL